MNKSKRILKKILKISAIVLSVLLSIILLIVAVPFAASVGMERTPLLENASTALKRAYVGESWMLGFGRILNGISRNPKDLIDEADYKSEYFYDGNNKKEAGETWRLGYAQLITTPLDWDNKTYYEGGNLSIPLRKLNNKLDELKTRVIALSDGGGINVFAAVDSIGITNKQVRQIRAMLTDLDLQSINITATHTHSGVDTVGYTSKNGEADADYIAFLNEKVAAAIRLAVDNMETGRLYISQIGSTSMEDYDKRFWDKMGFDFENDEWNDDWENKWLQTRDEMLRETTIEEYGLGEYIWNRRVPGVDYPTKLTKLRFDPDNESSKETALINFAAHPYTAGLKTGQWAADSISGDFPYYMEEVFNAAEMNFIYINGALNGIYPERSSVPSVSADENRSAYREDYNKTLDWHVRRMGRDFAAISLAMTMPPDEITKNELTNPHNNHSFEYRNIISVMQNNGTVAETELTPSLDIRLEELHLNIDNPLVSWAAKKGMMNANLIKYGKSVKAITEIGYMELGGTFSFALLPGEFTPGLAWGGGGTKAENAIWNNDFAYPTFSESAGRDVIVFGLCNDELGYVIPDNDYINFHNPFRNYNYKLFGTWDYEHYQELLSLGPHTASAFAEAFKSLLTRR